MNTNPSMQIYDFFLCHASEDKEAVVRPLFEALSSSRRTAWFDEAELVLGDSLIRKINEGILKSRIAIVVVSEAFLKKKWPRAEFDAFQQLFISSGKRILIVRHGVTHDRFSEVFPLLGHILTTDTQKSTQIIQGEIEKALHAHLREHRPNFTLKFKNSALIDRVSLAAFLTEGDSECRLTIEWPSYLESLIDEISTCIEDLRQNSS